MLRNHFYLLIHLVLAYSIMTIEPNMLALSLLRFFVHLLKFTWFYIPIHGIVNWFISGFMVSRKVIAYNGASHIYIFM